MATTKKKSQGKTFKGRVHKVVESDIFKSVAIVSILLNVLFLISVLVLTSTDTFNRGVYRATRDKYCQNIEAVKARAIELNDSTKAVEEWQIDCIGSQFQPYYEEAVIKFNAQQD